ncbi:MAG: hypothetical protein A2X13_10645 [Bacteroidetes bacterium GWC2_33_15]|nr:MAG: hypothetical protein A2X10_03195 [Bacteroidetes bacterium GWA2_33_15]OFX48856.1 MAG: hypothetical protein A2X13_10645 [Bacteroidetes bacterium GWC2_33_15]OFX66099.1 MAG: hypothetical protein A2X15_11790 [Bacteroidetes bacterium GWB2_32_14]OFX68139.1 MAG: hypothetical protein A2X14_07105 [Bacteroidetes bacterium GWD2_33_33]HAN17911.1 hypothetical protein [Bacteroidales bacterium]
MKIPIKIKGIIMLVIAVALFTACKQDSKNEENANESINELKNEMKEISSEIDNLTMNESDDFKTEAYLLLDKFNQKIEDFEIEITEKKQIVDQETKSKISQLKITSNKLAAKLDQLEEKTDDHLIEIKHELKYDFAEFGKSVENFFTDNK